LPAGSAGTTKPRSIKKRILEKTTFPSQSQIKLLRGRKEGEQVPLSLFLNLLTVAGQDRLIKDLRLEGISTIAEANRFLPESCLPKMNARFGRPALSAEDAHVSPDGFNVDDILCMEDERKVSNDYIIRFHARLFQILPETKVKPRPGNTAVVRTKPDNSIEIIWKDKPLPVKETTALFDRYK
jgi:hypothetical protein